MPSGRPIGQADIVIGADADPFTAELGRQATAGGKYAGNRFSRALGRTIQKAAKFTVYAAGAAAGATLIGGFKAAIDQQSAKKVLSGLYGNARQVKTVMKGLRQVSKSSPIDYGSYLKAAQTLAYAGVQGKDATKILKNTGLAISAAGGDQESLNQATDAILKMVNAGKVQLDTLQQLSNSGVPILSGLAKHFGVSIEQVNKMASAGKIKLDDVMSVMRKGTGDTFKSMIKAGKEANKSFGNVFKRIRHNVTDSIGAALVPVLDKLAPVLSKAGDAVSDFITEMSEGRGAGGQFADQVKRVVSGIGGMLSNLKPVASALATMVGWLFKGVSALSKHESALTAVKVVLAAVAAYMVADWIHIGASAVANSAKSVKSWWRVATGAEKVAKGATKSTGQIIIGWGKAAAAATVNAAKVAAAAVASAARTVASTKLVQGGMKAMRVAATVTGTAMRAAWAAITGPVGLVVIAIAAVGAALVLLYKKSETFRNIVNGAWNGLKAVVGAVARWFVGSVLPLITGVWNGIAAGAKGLWTGIKAVGSGIKAVWNAVGTALRAVWSKVLQPTFSGIATAFKALGSAFMSVWKGFLSPVLQLLGAMVKALFKLYIKVYFALIKTAWKAVGTVFRATWNNVIKPVLNGLNAAVKFMWKSVLKPTWGLMKSAWKAVGTLIKSVWTGVIKVAINAVGNKFKWLWTNVARPVWNSIKSAWGAVGDKVRSVWRNTIKVALDAVSSKVHWLWDKGVRGPFNSIKTAWSAVGTKVRNVWRNTIRTVFDAVKTAVGKVKSAFGTAVDGVKRAWNRLEGIAKKPIKFVVNTVLNHGLIAGFNKLAGIFHTQKISPIKLGFAGGSWVPGSSPHSRADNIPAMLTADEFVVKQRSARNVERNFPGALDYINRHGSLPGFAGGGSVNWDKVNKNLGPVEVKQGWLKNLADKLNPLSYVRKAVNGLLSHIPGGGAIGSLIKGGGKWVLSKAWDWAKGMFSSSDVGGKSTAGWKSLWNMIHSRFPAAQLFSSVRRGAKTATGFVSRHASGHAIDISPMKKIWDWLWPQRNKFAEVYGPWGMWLKGGPRSRYPGASTIARIHKDHIHIGSYLANEVKRVAGVGSGGARGMAKARLGAFGWAPSQWGALNTLWNGESGWDVHARNPSSGAYGIPQALPGSKMASAGSDWQNNAATQITWGMRYIKQRYGSPSRALSAWMSRSPHWYSGGGSVGPTLGGLPVRKYDSGGAWPPNTFGYNGTGRTEHVRTASQEQALRDSQGDLIIENLTISVDDLRKMETVADFVEMLKKSRNVARKSARSGRTVA